jgi:hypothetical protein
VNYCKITGVECQQRSSKNWCLPRKLLVSTESARRSSGTGTVGRRSYSDKQPLVIGG